MKNEVMKPFPLKKVALFFVAILVYNDIIAQQYTYELNSIPPSPNSSSLGKYSNFPVNLFSGTPNISIPIYELKERDIQVPIRLSYHASGRKVEEISSQVGLGWSLFAGGVITRTVRGVPDDYYGEALPPYGNHAAVSCTTAGDCELIKEKGQGYFYTGQYINDGIFRWWGEGKDAYRDGKDEWRDAFPAPSSKAMNLCDAPAFDPNYLYLYDNDPICSESDPQHHRNVVAAYNQHITGKGLDTEPDVFYFNFNGYNGSFLFDKDQNIIQIPQSNLKIDRTDSNDEITSFKITTPEGLKYFFEDVEVSNIRTRSCAFNSVDCDPDLDFVSNTTMEYNSSWYLTRIESPLHGIVNFTYNSDDISYNLRRNMARTSGAATDPGWPSSTISIKLEIQTKRLRKIYTESVELDFIPSDNHEYIQNGKAIEKINVKNVVGVQIESIQLEYDYWISSGGTSDIYKRLKLNSLRFPNEKTYTFNYSDIVLPHRESYEQDVYGYYNGNNSQTSLIPKIYAYPSLDRYSRFKVEKIDGYTDQNNVNGSFGKQYILEGQDRSVNPSFNQGCLLKSVIYPTGGSTEFFYESNRYYDPAINQDVLSGGLRIFKQESKASEAAVPIVINYDYTNQNGFSSGKLINKPIYAYPVALFWDYDCGSSYCTPNPQAYYSSGNSEYDNYNELVIRYATSQNGLEEVQGSTTGYTRVKEIHSDGGITEYDYSFPLPFGMEEDDESFSLITFRKDVGEMVKTSGFSNDVPAAVMAASADGFIWDGAYSGFDPPSRNYSAWRGLPLRIVTKNVNNGILKEEIFEYKPYRKEYNYTTKSVFGAFKVSPANIKQGFGVGHWLMNTQGFVAFYNPFDTSVPKLKRKETRYYDQIDDSKYISSETSYHYTTRPSDPLLTIREETLDSRGKEHITRFKYPQDFTSNIVFKNMDDNYIVSRPVEVVEEIDSKVTNANIYKFDCFNCDYDPSNGGIYSNGTFSIEEILNLDIEEPVVDYNYASSSFAIDSRFESAYKFNSYDEKGNMLEMSDHQGIITSLIWGYNSTYPVAKVVGATYNDIEGVTGFGTGFTLGNAGLTSTERANLRNELPNAHITTYAYEPLVGMTKMWDPNGQRTTYVYDDFNRLKMIKDDNGDIVERYKYNYASEANEMSAEYSVIGCEKPGVELTFSAMQYPGLTTYIWDFGDGTIIEGSDSEVTHTYPDNGKYTYSTSLSITNPEYESVHDTEVISLTPNIGSASVCGPFIYDPCGQTGSGNCRPEENDSSIAYRLSVSTFETVTYQWKYRARYNGTWQGWFNFGTNSRDANLGHSSFMSSDGTVIAEMVEVKCEVIPAACGETKVSNVKSTAITTSLCN